MKQYKFYIIYIIRKSTASAQNRAKAVLRNYL